METHTDEHREERKREWRAHMPIRVLTAVIVTIFVFWCGFEFGEIRVLAGSHQSHFGGESGMFMREGGAPMRGAMNVRYGGTTMSGSAQAMPAQPVPAPVTK